MSLEERHSWIIAESDAAGPFSFVSSIPNEPACYAWSARKFQALGEAEIYAPQLTAKPFHVCMRTDDPRVKLVEAHWNATLDKVEAAEEVR